MDGDAPAMFSLLDSMSVDTVDKILALEEKDKKVNLMRGVILMAVFLILSLFSFPVICFTL
jgi:hypothetical protein